MSKVKEEKGKEIKYFLPNFHTAFKPFQLGGFPELDVVCLISSPPFPSQPRSSPPNICPDSPGTPADALQPPHSLARSCPGRLPDAQRSEPRVCFLDACKKQVMQKDCSSVFTPFFSCSKSQGRVELSWARRPSAEDQLSLCSLPAPQRVAGTHGLAEHLADFKTCPSPITL